MFEVGVRVKVKEKWPDWFGKHKYPGKTGVIIRVIYADQGFVSVLLDETNRFKSRIEPFFTENLEIISE